MIPRRRKRTRRSEQGGQTASLKSVLSCKGIHKKGESAKSRNVGGGGARL